MGGRFGMFLHLYCVLNESIDYGWQDIDCFKLKMEDCNYFFFMKVHLTMIDNVNYPRDYSRVTWSFHRRYRTRSSASYTVWRRMCSSIKIWHFESRTCPIMLFANVQISAYIFFMSYNESILLEWTWNNRLTLHIDLFAFQNIHSFSSIYFTPSLPPPLFPSLCLLAISQQTSINEVMEWRRVGGAA